ncbi:hypothetical protein [Pseudogemmobacter sonorensis]|uniref:hypothetical protein n=1 Tax=Pseudogemmobacter sonorensis TaxID=2989681 RepID=UPI0036D13F56
MKLSRMDWPLRALIGPGLWALGFALTYGLHGIGCARGWPLVAAPFGGLQGLVLVAAFLLTLLATLAALLWVPRGAAGVERTAILAGGWIGFGSTLLTLFPVLGLTSCG